MMSERKIERKLVDAVKIRGGVCWKFSSPDGRSAAGTAGVPDRIILMPFGRIAFAEVKALGADRLSGEHPRKLQLARHRFLMKLGFKVYVIDSTEQIGGIIDDILTA